VADCTTNPWGERTSLKLGGEWPVRVDQFLEESVSEEEVDSWVRTASILHSNRNALDVAVGDERIGGACGSGVDRMNKGRLGPKNLFG
jgi:ferredoxin-nitrate reductase